MFQPIGRDFANIFGRIPVLGKVEEWSSLSVTRRTRLERFNPPVVHGSQTKFKLFGLCLGFPGKVGDLVDRAQFHLRLAMAFEAERHAERFCVVNFFHLIDAAMAFNTADAAIHVDGMIEISEVRQLVDLDPRNRLPARGTFPNQRQTRIILEDLIVAVHTGRCRGNIGKPGLFDGGMAVTAINPQLSGVGCVRERHRLNRLISDASVLRRAVIPDARSNNGTDEEATDDDQSR